MTCAQVRTWPGATKKPEPAGTPSMSMRTVAAGEVCDYWRMHLGPSS